MKILLGVNGVSKTVEVAPMRRLLDVLRLDLALTGTKEGCGEGECGACSVLLDGVLVNACLIPICQTDGAQIVTVEGLSNGAALSPLQRSFVSEGGAQCGICTPGMLVASHALLNQTPHPSEAQIREGLAGNLCRCTGYTKIVAAVQKAAATP